MFEGSVDEVTTIKATGWLYNRTEGRSSQVVAMLHGKMIGTAPSNLHRLDLEQVGFGDGLCGFEIFFQEALLDWEVPFVTISPLGSNLLISRTARSDYKDLVHHIIHPHPATGRNRTVLGGLWTDRTDSLQILSGRLAIGLCSSVIKDALREFITDGYLKLDMVRESSRNAVRVLDAYLDTPTSYEQRLNGLVELTRSLVTEQLSMITKALFDDIPVFYGNIVSDRNPCEFQQASQFDDFTSPAEVVAVYLPIGELTSRMDFIRDSHEFPEFGTRAQSRWSNSGITLLPEFIAERGQPVDSLDLEPSTLTIVGPGLIHRFNEQQARGVLRLLLTPRRNVPTNFLHSNCSWQESELPHGLRLRTTQFSLA